MNSSWKFRPLKTNMFGSQGQILADNGGEFNTEDFRSMGEKLDTKIKDTATESPWSNGINECYRC